VGPGLLQWLDFLLIAGVLKERILPYGFGHGLNFFLCDFGSKQMSFSLASPQLHLSRDNSE
jgi:hypothetical protein